MIQKKKSAADMFNEQAQNMIEDEPINASPSTAMAPQRARRNMAFPINTLKSSEDLQNEKEPLQARVTGTWFWRRVIVPPNAYVVHTRIGRKNPVTLGLGVSFRYNPDTDAYLIVPAAMQTIGVVANCISMEKQGINILAYVQWQINDFAVAYKKLDFSDYRDPLGVVNAQLREQAEAAIKDKIATMPVEEVLKDKEPIIQELTSRLKSVAEGEKTNVGLGIKISTVQIREALVSSSALWEDLQSPFRHEQRKQAEISSLEMNKEIQTRAAQTQLEIELSQQKKQTEITQTRLREEALRFQEEQNSSRERLSIEEETQRLQRESEERLARQEEEYREKAVESQKHLVQKEAELEKEKFSIKEVFESLKLQSEISLTSLKEKSEREIQEAREKLHLQLDAIRVEMEKKRRDIENSLSTSVVMDNLVAVLPEIASSLPAINELKVFSNSGGDPRLDGLVDFVAKILGVLDLEKIKQVFKPADTAGNP